MLGYALVVSAYLYTGIESHEHNYKRCLELRRKAITFKQESMLSLFLPAMQAVANLIGRSNDLGKLTGEFMDEDDFVERLSSTNHELAFNLVLMFRLTLNYLKKDYVTAYAAYKKLQARNQKKMSPTILFTELFMGGLAALKQCRPRIREAKAILKRLRKYARHCAASLANKVHLLEAEIAAANENQREALENYELSIAMAQRRGYLSDQAIACEHAAEFMLHLGRKKDGAKYQQEAINLYASLGMVPNANQLKAAAILVENDDTPIDFVLMK